MGLATGKYGRTRRPSGIRRVLPRFRSRRLAALEPLLALQREIAERHGATPSDVALRWLIEHGALPIPGAKNAQQAAANAGALRLTLDPRGDQRALGVAALTHAITAELDRHARPAPDGTELPNACSGSGEGAHHRFPARSLTKAGCAEAGEASSYGRSRGSRTTTAVSLEQRAA
jgi:hypothetical protein